MIYGVFGGCDSDQYIVGYFNTRHEADEYCWECAKGDYYVKPIRDLTEVTKLDLENLEKLLDSDDYMDRIKVAESGNYLNLLINDPDPYVRREVAKQGYGLDILINDVDNVVVDAVAEQGYRLDKMINGKSVIAAHKYLKEHNYESVFDWAKDNGIYVDIDKWLHSDIWIQRCEVARAGYRLDVLIKDTNVPVYNEVCQYLKKHHYRTIEDWARANNIKIKNKKKKLFAW